jgi:hypothetical protein
MNENGSAERVVPDRYKSRPTKVRANLIGAFIKANFIGHTKADTKRLQKKLDMQYSGFFFMELSKVKTTSF